MKAGGSTFCEGTHQVSFMRQAKGSFEILRMKPYERGYQECSADCIAGDDLGQAVSIAARPSEQTTSTLGARCVVSSDERTSRTLMAQDGAAADGFGFSVSVSGDTGNHRLSLLIREWRPTR